MKKVRQKKSRYSDNMYDMTIPEVLEKATKFAETWGVDLSEVYIEATEKHGSPYFQFVTDDSLETWPEVDQRLAYQEFYKEQRRKQFEQLKKEFGNG